MLLASAISCRSTLYVFAILQRVSPFPTSWETPWETVHPLIKRMVRNAVQTFLVISVCPENTFLRLYALPETRWGGGFLGARVLRGGRAAAKLTRFSSP